MKFHTVVIVFNPNSTGSSQSNATDLVDDLKKHDPSLNIEVIATKYAGHAEEIARSYAGDATTLVVSSSGDGGYNEVINGVLSTDGKCAVAVLPSGNANDHANSVGPEDIVRSITSGSTKQIEVIKVDTSVDSKPWTRYAHSYVGFGLTPQVGKVLTEVRPNVVTEKWYVLRHIFSFKHVKIESGGETERYHSLVAATIDRMSKVIKLDQSSDTNDGMMEIYESKYFSPFKTIKELLKAGINGVSRTTRVKTFTVRIAKPTAVQLDGEVFMIDAKSEVKLHCVKNALTTLR